MGEKPYGKNVKKYLCLQERRSTIWRWGKCRIQKKFCTSGQQIKNYPWPKIHYARKGIATTDSVS